MGKFTCRTEEKHDQALERIGKKNEIKTRQKTLHYVLETFETVVTDRDTYFQRMNKLEKELSSVKSAIKAKMLADADLKKIIE